MVEVRKKLTKNVKHKVVSIDFTVPPITPLCIIMWRILFDPKWLKKLVYSSSRVCKMI